MLVRSDRRFRFGAEPDEVWRAISKVEEYRSWWPWLRRFDANSVAEGERWPCTIRPPMPYALHFTVELQEVVAPERIHATVTGDITGEARVTLTAVDGGSEVRLVADLAPANGPLRTVATLAPWLARFGHDWVLDTGFRQFRRRAL